MKNKQRDPMCVRQLTATAKALSNCVLYLRHYQVSQVKQPLSDQVSYEPLLNPSEPISIAWPREKCLPHDKVTNPSWAFQITHCPAGAC